MFKKISTGELAEPIARDGERVLCEIRYRDTIRHGIVLDWQFEAAELENLPRFHETYSITGSSFTEKRWRVGEQRYSHQSWF